MTEDARAVIGRKASSVYTTDKADFVFLEIIR